MKGSICNCVDLGGVLSISNPPVESINRWLKESVNEELKLNLSEKIDQL